MAKRIFITGASSGLGAGLALRYAAEGVVIGLVARRHGLLQELAQRLDARGAQALCFEVDVRDTAAMQRASSEYLSRTGGIDLVIANAGVSRRDYLRSGEPAPIAEVLATNVIGVTNTVIPFVPSMVAAQSGTLVAVGSIAGFRGLPGHGGYCASKAAVKTFMDAVRMDLRGTGVHAMTLCPGFVRTPMVEGAEHPTPFKMELDTAVEVMVRAIEHRRSTYSFPVAMRALKLTMRVVPEAALRALKRLDRR